MQSVERFAAASCRFEDWDILRLTAVKSLRCVGMPHAPRHTVGQLKRTTVLGFLGLRFVIMQNLDQIDLTELPIGCVSLDDVDPQVLQILKRTIVELRRAGRVC